MKLWVVGIDNGVTGSIGVVKNLENDFDFVPMFVRNERDFQKKYKKIQRIDFNKLLEFFKKLKEASREEKAEIRVYLERPLINPRFFYSTLSAVRAFESTLIALSFVVFPFRVVDSKVWQKYMLPKGLPKKEASLKRGEEIAPFLKEKFVKHGDADGFLIAYNFYKVSMREKENGYRDFAI